MRNATPLVNLVTGLLGAVLVACASEAPEPTPPAVTPTPPIFRDVAVETGLDLRHVIGSSGAYYLPEIMGAGVALVDYDADDDLDIYLLQGTMLGPTTGETAGEGHDDQVGHRLFRNELSESGRLGFVDVTDQAGVGLQEYDMGVAVGDVDNDRDPRPLRHGVREKRPLPKQRKRLVYRRHRSSEGR